MADVGVPKPEGKANEHVVVTGGLGFIGSFVADAYLAAGNSVTIIDSEVAHVIDGDRYEDHPNCVLYRQSVEKFFEKGGSFAGADRVIHAASRVGPVSILPHAGGLGGEIVRSASYVIDACLREDIPLCVFSSAEVYGRSGDLGEHDDIRVPIPYNARIEYAIAKTLTEAMTLNSIRRGLRAIVIRPFNVAGPRQSRAGGFVMPTFVQQALGNRPITVFHTGKQVRAFLAVSDLIRFMLDFMDLALDAGKKIYNVGNPLNRTTIRALAERVKYLTASGSPIVKADARKIHSRDYAEAESFVKVPILDAATKLGWKPLVDLDDLIGETIDYYREWIDYGAERAAV